MTRNTKLSLLAILLVGILTLGGCIPVSTGETPSSGFDWTFIVIVVVFGLAIYFFMIRPQRNQQKQQQKLMNELVPGDRVITASGIYGDIVSLDERSAVLKIESGATIRVARSTIVGKRSE